MAADMELSKGVKDARSDRLKVEAEQQCPACEQMLWVSFYFDGFGCSDKEGPRTNIKNLFDVVRDDRTKNERRYYYPGLGAQFDPETAALAAVIGDRFADRATDKVKDDAKEKAKDKAKDITGEAWQRSRRMGSDSLVGRVGDATDEAVRIGREEARHAARSVRHKLSHPGRVARDAGRFLRREWRSFGRAVAKHPWRLGKEVGKEVIKVTAGEIAESVGILRDSKLLAGLFNTGVDTRLKAAEQDFSSAVVTARQNSRLHKIHIAIFGYDMGGALALAFAQRLMKEICPGGLYEGTPVKIKFMGLFDCVTTRYDPDAFLGYIPLAAEVAPDLKLLPYVEKCVHYAAAHELRFYKRLSMIGADPADYRGPRQERLFPGSQEDVGGGVPDGEDDVSNKLSRLPLQMMYNRAYGAGVPMPSLAELQVEDPQLHGRFTIPEEVEKFHLDYRQSVKALVKVVRKVPALTLYAGAAMERDARTADAGSECRVPTTAPIMITDLPEDISEEERGHMTVYIQWLRMWFDRNKEAVADADSFWSVDGSVSALARGRYAKLSREIDHAERALPRVAPHFNRQQAVAQVGGSVSAGMFNLDPQAQALLWLWDHPGERLPGVEKLYGGFLKYIHDSMAESELESAYSHFVAAKSYLNVRTMEKIDSKPDKSFLERVDAVYEGVFD